MSNCIEVMFASTSSDSLCSSSMWDPKTGTKLMTYRNGGNVPPNALAFINKDYVVSAEINKPILNFWQMNSQEPNSSLKTVVNGKISALDVSPDGLYCIAGIGNKIYIWQVITGRLLNILSRHYQNITKIKFCSDNVHFVSSGDDGIVLVWKLNSLIQQNTYVLFRDDSESAPLHSFSNHTLPVTDFFIGSSVTDFRLFSVSLDQTLKVYSLTEGKLLLSVVYDHALTAVTLNTSESLVFIGTSSGKIFKFSLEPPPRTLEYLTDERDIEECFNRHNRSVTCLSCSFNGSSLLSGSVDGTILIWHIATYQVLRTFNMKSSVTNAFFCLSYNNMFAKSFRLVTMIQKFKKALDDDSYHIVALCNDHVVLPFSSSLSLSSSREVEHVNVETCFIDDTKNVEVVDSNDINYLREEVKRLKKANTSMYLYVLDHLNCKVVENESADESRSRQELAGMMESLNHSNEEEHANIQETERENLHKTNVEKPENGKTKTSKKKMKLR